ncbi:MAG: Gfo/Idh/MocA family oxidoreductase [Pseudobutyrivibrio sp.]|nr:Gfo/Idh/MocA family oxidoreductase [Pseudobutyrivibrio sp.]
MSKQIKIGVIGCGTISNVYLSNITEHYKNVEVVAVADLVLEKAKETAEKYGIGKVCSVDELLAISEIELVLNLTIPAAHYSVNMQVLNAGKNVYCEKPLTLKLEEAKEVVELAKKKGLIAVSAPDTFLGPGAQTVRAMIDKGDIGEPIGFTANMTCAGHELWHPSPEFYYKQGGGPMFDMGPYYLTTLVSLLGPIKQISCFAKKARPVRIINGKDFPTEMPTHYTGLVEFVNGAIGTITMSFDTWKANLPCCEIYGTKGSVNVPDPNLFAGEIKLFDGMKLKNIIDNYDEVPPVPVLPKLFAMVTKTAECEEVKPSLYPSPEDIRTNMRGLGVSDIAQGLIDGRKSRLDEELSLHIVEALNAFEISSQTGKVYEMTTTCQRPEPMEQGKELWQV